jgi:DNA repair protein RAD7
MAMLNPNLERLTVHFCGQMESAALEDWSRSLKYLTRLELNAPFLIREEAWVHFLRAKGSQLKGFLITNAPRFNKQCLDALIESAPDLTELRLSELTTMDNLWLEGIATFKSLTTLDLSSDRSGRKSLTSEATIDLLNSIGKNLTLLNLNAIEELDDTVLNEGIALYCNSLKYLELTLLPLLTDEGVSTFFKTLPRSNRLTHLNISRCHLLESSSLHSLLEHSGLTLEVLNINGCKGVGEDALSTIAEKAPRLVELDVGWCREVNDLVIGKLLKENESKLRKLKCFGCNRITQNCPRKVKCS